MLEILQFYVSGFWVWAGITFGLTIPFNFAFRVINRFFRFRNIANRGWPTAPLMDADGDIVHPKEAT